MEETTQERPLVTFALFAYNQEKYIREAIEGAFSQTYEPLEIILSDDCSTDRTFEIMQEMADKYEGLNKVTVRKNEINLGVSGHVNEVIKLCGGKFLVAAAGDDVSMSDRTSETVSVLEKNNNLTFCESAYVPIDETGRELSSGKCLFSNNEKISLRDYISDKVKGLTGAARTYRLHSLRSFPPLNKRCPTEDSPFVLRCLLTGDAYYFPKAFVKRRTHGENLSGKESLRKMDLGFIWEQYRSDLKYSHKKKYIGKNDFIKTKLWIVRVSYERELSQKIDNNQFFITNEVLESLIKSQGFWPFIMRARILSKIVLKRVVM
ncbi:glycosyltransferase family 2 protein [Halomonas alimentaria]|uniref:glycosyltransferase family 2 protein n=1 Tax=Halomonas alimentaria TaxID=147248 RepID=UPI0024930CD1|nr:glycosyltransferase family 2 protein [Halomonas alimentaria]